ncbi:unnamed protein product [Fraxinus pennsylvanica]|uniref:X8 domain-containing protein n=1 Tax=Fraxinus pennsylvanica TaxID=56036 RepID=A0AAD1ZWN7_9LAMI|nr:unnamed protein product [Fraxinus pennsylvanica]
MAAPPSTVVVTLLFFLCTTTTRPPFLVVVRWTTHHSSDASDQAMLAGLNFACAAGADCAPLQSSGLCYLPNTIQAHASYAYNSYYQRRNNDPASCYFSGTATIAKTDPSYGSCVYPSSPSTAGGSVGPGGMSVPGTPAISATPPPPGTTTAPLLGAGGLTPDMGTADPDSPKSSNASPNLSINAILFPKDLAGVNKEVTPLLVATWHPLWYSSYTAHYREAEFGDDGNRKKMSITHVDEPGKCPEPSITLDYFIGGFCACNFTSGPEAAKFYWDQQPE